MKAKLIDLIFSTPKTISIGMRNGKSFMSVANIADHLIKNGVVIPIRCKDCANKEPCTIRGKVWCRRMGRYMKEDGYCSEGDADEALQQLP